MAHVPRHNRYNRQTHRTHQPFTPRPSLLHVNAIFIYLQWVREARYMREDMGPKLPSFVGSVAASDTQQQLSVPPTIPPNVKPDVAHDLLGLGTRFGEAEAEGRVVGYASELEILG